MKEKNPEENFHGVPKSQIPWGPSINYKKCLNCGKCVEYCRMGVYELQEKNGETRSIVTNPNGCVVLCTGCQDICPAGAISHPSKKETREFILKLKKEKKK